MHDEEPRDDEQTRETLCAIRGSEVTIRPVEWLCENTIPRGKVAVLDGNPGLGKSLITVDLAARVTTGRPMPDGSQGLEGDVVAISFEDDAKDTIVPRFLAAFGDGPRIHIADSVESPAFGRNPLEIPEHVDALEAYVTKWKAVLVVIDPLMAALGADVRSGIDHDIRRALMPLRSMAERTGAAVVLVRHLNKATKVTDPILRGGGSIGIIGAARAGLVVAKDPEDERQRILAVTKSNLGPDDRMALRYRVVTDDTYGVAAVDWLGRCDTSAEDLLRPAEPESGTGPALSEAVGLLSEYLAGGPRSAVEAKKYMHGTDVSGRTLDRAKKKLGVRTRRRMDGQTPEWWWELPGHVGKDANDAVL